MFFTLLKTITRTRLSYFVISSKEHLAWTTAVTIYTKTLVCTVVCASETRTVPAADMKLWKRIRPLKIPKPDAPDPVTGPSPELRRTYSRSLNAYRTNRNNRHDQQAILPYLARFAASTGVISKGNAWEHRSYCWKAAWTMKRALP